MGYEFKEGDVIRMLQDCSDCIKGQEYTLFLDAPSLFAKTPFSPGCSCEHKWVLVRSCRQEITFENCEVGDLFTSKDGENKAMVLAKSGKLVWSSLYDNFNRSDNDPQTISDFKKSGYKFIQPEIKKKETVKIGEKVYDKAEFEQATKDLKSIN